MDATENERATRARAIDGLRAIAMLEEYVAAEIDEAGYYGDIAAVLRASARDRRLAAQRLGSDPKPPSSGLRLVT